MFFNSFYIILTVKKFYMQLRSKMYHITRFMCVPYLEKWKPTFLLWFIKRSSVHLTATLSNLNWFR